MARNTELNQKMRDERREAILSHALRLFATRGVGATKIADVAESVGMSQGLLYHYFPSKEAIFTEIVRDAFAKMNTAVRMLEEMPAPPREKIRMALAHLLRNIEESEAFAATVMLNAQAGVSDATPPDVQAIIRAESDKPYQAIARILRAGQRNGTIKRHDPDEMAVVFWTIIKGLAMHRAVHGTNFKAPDVAIFTGLFFTEGDDDERE